MYAHFTVQPEKHVMNRMADNELCHTNCCPCFIFCQLYECRLQ